MAISNMGPRQQRPPSPFCVYCVVLVWIAHQFGCGLTNAEENYRTMLQQGGDQEQLRELYEHYHEKVLVSDDDQSDLIAAIAGDESLNDAFLLACLSNGWVVRARDVSQHCLPHSGVWAFSEPQFAGLMCQYPADCRTMDCVDIGSVEKFKIQSLRIGRAIRAQLFNLPNFQGDSKSADEDQANLVAEVQSIKIRTPPRIDYVSLSEFQENASQRTCSFRIHLSGANIDQSAIIRFGKTELHETSIQTRVDNSSWLGLGRYSDRTGCSLDPTYYAYPIYHYDSIVAHVADVPCGQVVTLQLVNPDGQSSNHLQWNVPRKETLDSDGDGLLDVWETSSALGLDLVKLGANPHRRDLFVEVDRMVVQNRVWSDFAPSDYPRSDIFADAEELFGQAPILNPDGSQGISLHIDYGQEQFEQSGRGQGGTEIPWKRYIGLLPVEDRNEEKLKAGKDLIPVDQYVNAVDLRNDSRYFDQRRRKVFRYCVFADQQWRSRSTGGGNANTTFFLSLGVCRLNAVDHNYQLAIFIHEFGHTLGLSHAGDPNDFNYKPNFNSLMNYSFTTSGQDIDGKLGDVFGGLTGDQVFVYSEGMRADLNEAELIETLGVANHFPHDWNGNGKIDREPIRAKVRTSKGHSTNQSFNPKVVRDSADWTHLKFKINASVSEHPE